MQLDYDLTTSRLRLYAPTQAEVAALVREERAALGARLGATISEEWWQGSSLIRLLPNLAGAMAREPGDARWVWLVIEPIQARVVGDIGFHSPWQAAATAEIGYSVIPQVRGFGYTTEAVATLIAWAFAHSPLTQIIAQIEPGNAASLRVAAKLGMRELPALSTHYRCFGISRTPA